MVDNDGILNVHALFKSSLNVINYKSMNQLGI